MLPKFEEVFVKGNQFLIGAMMGIMFVLVFTNVVTRYCFGFSIATAEEISTFLMIWVTYLGAGLALREGRHASIDLFQDLLGERFRLVLRVLLGIVLLGFFGVLGWFGVRFAQFGWRVETIATQIPKGIPYLGIPIGATLFIVHLLLMFKRWIDRDWTAAPVADADDLAEGGR